MTAAQERADYIAAIVAAAGDPTPEQIRIVLASGLLDPARPGEVAA